MNKRFIRELSYALDLLRPEVENGELWEQWADTVVLIATLVGRHDTEFDIIRFYESCGYPRDRKVVARTLNRTAADLTP